MVLFQYCKFFFEKKKYIKNLSLILPFLYTFIFLYTKNPQSKEQQNNFSTPVLSCLLKVNKMLNTCKVLVKHGCKDICINVCLCVCGFMYIQNVHTYCPVRYTYNKQFLMQLHAPEAATINIQQIPFQHKKQFPTISFLRQGT